MRILVPCFTDAIRRGRDEGGGRVGEGFWGWGVGVNSGLVFKILSGRVEKNYPHNMPQSISVCHVAAPHSYII